MTDLKEQPKSRPVEEAPPLPDTYHRARRNLVLFSALLLSWEFVGIKPNDETSTSLIGISVNIANPQAIPFVVFLLVLFFIIRFEVEWRQAPIDRQKNSFAKVDVSVSRILAAVSVGVFAFQSTTNINITTEFSALNPSGRLTIILWTIGFLYVFFITTPTLKLAYWGIFNSHFRQELMSYFRLSFTILWLIAGIFYPAFMILDRIEIDIWLLSTSTFWLLVYSYLVWRATWNYGIPLKYALGISRRANIIIDRSS